MAFATFQDLKDTTFVAGGKVHFDRYVARLKADGVNVILHGHDEIAGFIERKGACLNDAFLSFPHVGATFLPMLRERAPHCRVVYDMVDFHAERMRKGADLSGDPEERRAADQMAITETALFKGADVVFAVTEVERRAVLALVPGADVRVLPNAFDLRSKPSPGFTGRTGVVFLGGYWHAPNRDAVRWLVDEIWPIVRGLRPNAELRLGGANMSDEIKALGGRDGIITLGQIDDIDAFYDTARISIAPLRYGAGMKGKVGQALAYGVPIVSTSVGIEGIDIIDGEHALVADDAAGFAAAIVRLIDDDPLWTSMSKAGPALIQATLSPAALGATLREAYRRAAL